MDSARIILVTGGAGFIGSALVRRLVADGTRVVNLDSLTYAAAPGALDAVADNPAYTFEKGDIRDRNRVAEVMEHHRPDAVIHLAAESHVDRSIDDPLDFVDTNVMGTAVLLEAALDYWNQLDGSDRDIFRFVHVSTDEVFGSLGDTGRFDENSRYAPNSPYAASKAGADHLARAWHVTYGLPVVMSNCSNNYGPFQFPEKLIPLMILTALEGRPLPVYGDGRQVRDWLHVDDHVDGLLSVLASGRPGQSYNIGGHGERTNIEVVRKVCDILDEVRPDPAGPRTRLITHTTDRPGHDRRYAIDPGKIERELAWRPARTLEEGLRDTVCWYLDNVGWWQAIRDGGIYDGGRLGLRAVPGVRA